MLNIPVPYYQKTYGGKKYRAFFNTNYIIPNLKDEIGSIQPPTKEEIAALQLQKAHEIYTKSIDSIRATNFINSILNDKTPVYQNYNEELTHVNKLLEKWFLNNERVITFGESGEKTMTTNRTGNASDLIKDFKDHENAKLQFKEVKKDLESILKIVEKYSTIYKNSFASTEIINAIKKIENGVNNINAYLSSGTYAGIETKTIFGTDKFQSKNNPNGASGVSAIKQINSISNALKGRINELMIIEAVEKMKISGLKVIDTAQWYVNGKQNYADFLAISKNLRFTYSINGKTYTSNLDDLEKKINGMSENVKIEISDEEWKHIMAAKSTLVGQVKSGVLQNPFNNKALSLQDLINAEMHKYTLALQAYITWYAEGAKDGSPNIYASSASNDITEYYEMYANYMLVKNHLRYVINEHEDILVMRGQIYTVEKYLNEMWKSFKRFIRFTQPIDISKVDRAIEIGMSDRRARYGHGY